MTRGEPVMVLVTDHHAAHIREHKALLDGRGRRELPPEVVMAITAHIEEHVAQWVQLTMGNPALLMATGQQPAPMAQPMMPPPGPGMAPGGPAPGEPAGMGAPPPPGVAETPPGGTPSEMPAMPQMPNNPATGERYQPGAPVPQ